MPQTLSVFLAMLLLVSFSVSQQRTIISTHGRAYHRAMSTAATDFALQRFAEIGSRAFDGNTSGMKAGEFGVADFSPAGEFGRSVGESLNDIDDYHDIEGEAETHRLGDQEFSFHVTTEVAYQNPDDAVAATRGKEWGKKVTITIYPDESAKERGRFFVKLSRTYTPEGVSA